MRALRVATAMVASLAATFALATPASATTYTVYDLVGDYARWNSDTNVLTVCDNHPSEGTAKAILAVNGGGTWTKYDDNGAQPGCGVAGPLNVDETKTATLYICANNWSTCYGKAVNL